MASDGGKGSTQRPTDAEAFSKGWEAVFGKKPDPRTMQDLLELGTSITLGGKYVDPRTVYVDFSEAEKQKEEKK